MRLLVITGTRPHHRHLCVELSRTNDVVAVLHPVSARMSRVEKLRREIRSRGMPYAALRAAASVKWLGGWPREAAYAGAEDAFFGRDEREFIDAAAGKTREVDVRDPATLELIRGLTPDATVCLGGPIYPNELIDVAAPVFNFHSGISPLYNGASTIDFAFVNGHVHMCGGTLMTMSSAVDGGDILAHYLPAIEPDDTPATLFMKTIRGGTATLVRFLQHFTANGGHFAKARQSRPLFYFRGRDWTLFQSQLVARAVAAGTTARFERPAASFEYWAKRDDGEARETMLSVMRQLTNLS